MTRDDIVSQAYSFATAKLRGQWHVFRGGKAGSAPPAEAATPGDAAVWEEILRILSREQRMAEFAAEQGLRLHHLTYEQLVTDKHMTVMRIMDLLRCPLPAMHAYLRVMDDETVRNRYDGKLALLGEFTSRYRPLIEQVLAERASLDVAAFRASLKAGTGIVA
jgi:LPS sulfotransferase NodH